MIISAVIAHFWGIISLLQKTNKKDVIFINSCYLLEYRDSSVIRPDICTMFIGNYVFVLQKDRLPVIYPPQGKVDLSFVLVRGLVSLLHHLIDIYCLWSDHPWSLAAVRPDLASPQKANFSLITTCGDGDYSNILLSIAIGLVFYECVNFMAFICDVYIL